MGKPGEMSTSNTGEQAFLTPFFRVLVHTGARVMLGGGYTNFKSMRRKVEKEVDPETLKGFDTMSDGVNMFNVMVALRGTLLYCSRPVRLDNYKGHKAAVDQISEYFYALKAKGE